MNYTRYKNVATDYKALYLLYCADLNDCTAKEDVKRHNAAMKQLGKLFYHIQGEQDKSFLLELLSNENDRTKALVAAIQPCSQENGERIFIGQSGRGVRRIGLYAICRVQKNAYMLYIL